jgi:hypothetical protein
VNVFRWDAPGCEVAFTTRLGGVSQGVFESLNLGRMTRDRRESVEENRRRVCAEIHAPYESLTLNRQQHSATVHRAQAGRRGDPGDGLWTDEPGVPMLKLTADCVPVAIARTSGTPTLALLHAGWRGLLEGVVAAGVSALGGPVRAAIGPAIGPCCYEVGPDVSEPFGQRFGHDVVRAGRLDLWTSAERALREAGCTTVERIDLCTACNEQIFFSHRRDGGVTGRQGVIGVVVG